VWKENYEEVEKFNSQDHTYKKGMNQFGDMTSQEFKEYIKPMYFPTQQNTVRTPATKKIKDLPANVDWRTKGAVTAIYDQGQCGSSPYWSAIESMEGVHVISGQGSLVALSTQQIIDCSNNDIYNNQGCNGGWMNASIQYVIDNKGIASAASYPYNSQNGTSNPTCEYKVADKVASFDAYVNIEQTEEALTEALSLRTVASAVAYDENFQFYSWGVFNDPSCGHDIEHGIGVVGYGTFTNGTEYYILKNTWGTTWGMDGFMLLARNAGNMCGIASAACYAVINSKA